ncbi:hypothetical protein [Prevotella sp.]|uniref:hypothetical protein n=1 Tax=Prevotella sp. TaxID=59823 RepID=UPI002600F974|nr:hypothetical protein [Prevotella sp.]
MNNEETIFMQPQNNNNEAEHTQNVKAAEKKSDKAKKVVATAAASVMGGVVGGGTTYAATEMLHDKEADEQKPEEEAQATEEPVAKEPQKVEHAEAQKEEVAVKMDDNDESAEPDYTNHAGADPVTPNPEVQATVDEASDSNANTNEVQVLGVYETQGENGQTMQAAMLTNGEEVAAVVDLDSDGVADVLLVDENHNQQIDEGEVYDLSNDNVQMSVYQDAYQAQQQAQQENDTFAYNANEDQQDYDNDADPQYL